MTCPLCRIRVTRGQPHAHLPAVQRNFDYSVLLGLPLVEVPCMKRFALFVLGVLALSGTAFTQAPDEALEKALAAAPRQLKDGATVIKWKADGTYDTLRKGTNRLVCYDQSGEPTEQ